MSAIANVEKGQEDYQEFYSRVTKKNLVQYDYRHTDGELFSTVKKSLDECRTARDKWLESKRKKELKKDYEENGFINIQGYYFYFNNEENKYITSDTSGLHDDNWSESDNLDTAIDDYYELLLSINYYEMEE